MLCSSRHLLLPTVDEFLPQRWDNMCQLVPPSAFALHLQTAKCLWQSTTYLNTALYSVKTSVINYCAVCIVSINAPIINQSINQPSNQLASTGPLCTADWVLLRAGHSRECHHATSEKDLFGQVEDPSWKTKRIKLDLSHPYRICRRIDNAYWNRLSSKSVYSCDIRCCGLWSTILLFPNQIRARSQIAAPIFSSHCTKEHLEKDKKRSLHQSIE